MKTCGPSGSSPTDCSPQDDVLQAGSVQVFYRATGRLSTGNCSQPWTAPGEHVAGGSQRGECQESDSEAANTASSV